MKDTDQEFVQSTLDDDQNLPAGLNVIGPTISFSFSLPKLITQEPETVETLKSFNLIQ